jgi:hypothetical protein
MDEKERRVELHRLLMEKEQALAELKMYVKLLEEKVEQRPPPRLRTRPVPPPPPAMKPPAVPKPPMAAAARPKLKAVPRLKVPMNGWRAW